MPTSLIRGQKVRVDNLTSATRLELELVTSGTVSTDVSCFGLDGAGQLSDDAYFVFYNQLSAPGGCVTLAPSPAGGLFTVDLPSVPASIDRLVLAVTIDGGGSMADLTQCRAAVSAGGELLALYEGNGSEYGAEQAVMVVELYRRDGWRLTVVGQGFNGGLDALLRHFGGEVADDSPPPPPPAAAPPAGAPAVPPAPPNLAKVTLDKGRVTLAKRQVVSLTKAGASTLTKVRMGLGWDPAKAGKSIDLDASCITFDSTGKKLDVVYFGRKKGAGGAIMHQGDNLTGAGDGDDEVIKVDLTRLPPTVDAIVFTVNSFRGQKFTEVKRAFCRLVDDASGQEMVRFDLTESEPSTAVIMCILHRAGATWDMTAIGDFATGRTAKALVDPARVAHASLAR